MQLYRPMLKEALAVAWKFKYLWFFGLFAALVGNGEAYNLGVKNLSKVESGGVWLADFKELVSNWRLEFGGFSASRALEVVDVWGAIIITLIIAVGIFLLWLSVSSQGALAYGAGEALKGRNSIFSEAFKMGLGRFWPVLLLNIVLNLSIFVLLVLVSLPFVILFMNSVESGVWQTILIILSFIVLVPVAIVLSLIVRYALIYVVNYDKHIGGALADGWRLFVKNWIVSLEMGFLLFLINILTGLALVVVMILVALPFVMLGMLGAQLASSGFLWLILTLGILTFIAMMFLYGAIWNTFAMAAWVILFERITKGVVYSKILRWAVWLGGGRKEEAAGE